MFFVTLLVALAFLGELLPMADEQKQNTTNTLTSVDPAPQQPAGKERFEESPEISSLEGDLQAIIKEARENGERFEEQHSAKPSTTLAVPERLIMKTEEVEEPAYGTSIPHEPEDAKTPEAPEADLPDVNLQPTVPIVSSESSVSEVVSEVPHDEDVTAAISPNEAPEQLNSTKEENSIEVEKAMDLPLGENEPTPSQSLRQGREAPSENQPIFVPEGDEIVDLSGVSSRDKDWDLKDAPALKKDSEEHDVIASKDATGPRVTEPIPEPHKPEILAKGDDELDRQLKELGVLTPEGKPALRDTPAKPPPTVSYRTSEYVPPAPKPKPPSNNNLILLFLIITTFTFTVLIILTLLARQGYNIPLLSQFVRPTTDRIVIPPTDRDGKKVPEASPSGNIPVPVASPSANPSSSPSASIPIATPSSGFLGGTQASPSGDKL